MVLQPFNSDEIYEVFNSHYDDETVINLEIESASHLDSQISSARYFLEENPDKKYKIVVPSNGYFSQKFQKKLLILNILFKIDVIIELSINESTRDLNGINENEFDVSICSYFLNEVIPFASDIRTNKLINESPRIDHDFVLYQHPYSPSMTNDLGLYIKYGLDQYTNNLKHFFGVADIYAEIYKMDSNNRELFI